MDFEFTSSLWVEPSDLKRMKKKVRKGKDPEEVLHEWAIGLDDSDYYMVEFVKEDILKEISKRA